MSYQSLIKHIRRRTRSLGIGTAADYLRELEVCLHGRCPSGLLDGASRRTWHAWLKSARRKLVYHHAEMRPVTEKAEGKRQKAEESLSSPYDLPPHTIATFPAVITTTRQDLDGDVLETTGAQLDPRAPLLWQHLPDFPIGRLLDVGDRTATRLTGQFAIADTALGNDAALLAEHGALRISHGFLPTKWKPLDTEDPLAGYHILEFKILEVSLVSIPSNPDAVIEAFSREKLAHPLVKAWAAGMFDRRPATAAVVCSLSSLETKEMNPTIDHKAGRALNAVNERRVRAARFHFKAIEHHDDSGDELSMLAQKATLPLDEMLDQLDGDAGKSAVAAAENKAGDPHAEREGYCTRAGRTVSSENADRLTAAIAHGDAIAQHQQATPDVSSLATGAVKHIKGVLDSNQQDDDGDMGYGDGDPTGCAALPAERAVSVGSALCGVPQTTERSSTVAPRSAKEGIPYRSDAASSAIEPPLPIHPFPPAGTSPMQTETQLQPADVFNTAAGQPRVKRASEQYDSTKRRLIWPNDKKSALHLGRFAGHDVTFENRPAYESSQLEKAQAGAWLKHKLASQLGTAHLLSDHDRDLYQDLVERGEWVGEVRDGAGTHYYREASRLSPPHQKTLLADSTSGGQYAVPYFFDVDLVTFPLLYGELFPLVDLRELNTSNQVKGATLANMTISSGPAEGDTPSITLATTSGLVGQLTTNIYNATGAITVGRDFLSDSPVDLQADIISLYQRALLQWLDKEIAVGDGTTGPLGLFNTSNVLTATSKNSTAGPMTVSDIEGMVKTLPKQYRNKQENVVWVASDGLYFRIRGISVSGTDARRIFGYDYEQYMPASHPFKVENDVAGSDLAFVNLSKYRMWRRKGMEIQVSDEGKTLMLANELLIVARSRWGGQLIDPSAMVEMTNAALH
jgi:HK97 family phage major capsid protein/HK97 family phage prohead protease